MRYQIKRVYNIVCKLNDYNGDDVIVISFATRYEAKQLFNKCRKYLQEHHECGEWGNENKGDMCCFTLEGTYYYVRLQRNDLLSAAYQTVLLNEVMYNA